MKARPHIVSGLGRLRAALGINDLQRAVASHDEQLAGVATTTQQTLQRIEHLLTVGVQGLHPRRDRGVDQAVQLLLRRHYADLLAAGQPLPSFADAEMRFFSQNGEDGIVQLIFAAVGERTRRAVEICAGDGIECNSANLVVNHGWTALLVDGGDQIVTAGAQFYTHSTNTWYWPPTLRQAWVTRDTVNTIVRDAGFDGDIDLLTIDVDGVDYWIWDALDCVDPRVVIVEFSPCWPADVAKTIPYRDDFVWEKGTLYAGASLAAMCRLAARKGYRLVGGNRYGFNAFFVRNDLAVESLPTVAPESLLNHPAARQSAAHLDTVLSMEWVDV